MADPNKVKLFKQYLTETNAFQSLVTILALLRKCDPKPSDPMEFIRQRLTESPIDAGEFQAVKQCLAKLNDDMGQLKSTVSKLEAIVSKLSLPKNDSAQSMENNFDASHITMLDDSMDCDDTINQTVIDCANFDSTMVTKTAGKDNSAGFTVEIVEVDVVQQSQCSQDSLPVSQESPTAYTSTPNTSLIGSQSSDFGQNGTSTDEITADTTNMASESDSQMKVHFEDLPIVMKIDTSDESPQLSQPFCGFGSQDVQNSQEILSSSMVEHSNSMEITNEDESNQPEDGASDKQVSENTQQIENNSQIVEGKAKFPGSNTENDENDGNESDEKQTLVAEIVNTMVCIVEDTLNVDAIDNCSKNAGEKCIPTMNDDPETKFLLSFC